MTRKLIVEMAESIKEKVEVENKKMLYNIVALISVNNIVIGIMLYILNKLI